MNLRDKILIGGAIVLCSLFLLIGYLNDDGPKKAAPKPEKVAEETTYQYEDPKEDEQEEIDPGAPSQDENFSKEEQEASKKVAIEFAKTFHTFDAANPAKSIEDSKKYMDEDLYKDYMKNIPRGTLDAVKKKPLGINVTQTANTSKEKLIWNVVVQSENIDNDGNKHSGEDWYLVQLEKQNGQYKVTGVSVDAAH